MGPVNCKRQLTNIQAIPIIEPQSSTSEFGGYLVTKKSLKQHLSSATIKTVKTVKAEYRLQTSVWPSG